MARTFAPRLAAAIALALVAGGCVDSVGVSCPNGSNAASCSIVVAPMGDARALDDLRAQAPAADELRLLVDLALADRAALPDLARPDLASPDLGALIDLTAPVDGAIAPDLAQPDLAQPDLAQPDLAQPDLAQPDLACGGCRALDGSGSCLAGVVPSACGGGGAMCSVCPGKLPLCTNHKCFAACQSSSDCPGTASCVQGLCTKSCASDSDCSAGMGCLGGVCAVLCSSRSDCPGSSQQCVASIGGTMYCASPCSSQSNCVGASVCTGAHLCQVCDGALPFACGLQAKCVASCASQCSGGPMACTGTQMCLPLGNGCSYACPGAPAECQVAGQNASQCVKDCSACAGTTLQCFASGADTRCTTLSQCN